MSAIFISHSSADNAVAEEAKAVLAKADHRSVFLDFDPAHGIPAGRRWESELYARLRACQAMLVLCSEASMASAWCFAEITHARALGKPLFPLKVAACNISALLGDVQVTDLTVDRAQGWQRLIAGLKVAGLDPSSWFDWDGSRPPYPGLLAFQKEDAAVYFGREAAIRSTIETFERLRRLGGPRLVLVLGASGSGKSSLVRAGVAPRLERAAARWLVAPPMRPQSRPLDALALALAALPGAWPWQRLRERLSSDPWRELLNDIGAAAGNETALLLVVDQLEEALAPDGAEAADFLQLLKAVGSGLDERLFAIATLRSDFLGAFQTHAALAGVQYEAVHLPPIELAEIAQVIEGPAHVAGIVLEPGLSQAMVADTATNDALPLLAFTLRELWDRFGSELRRGGRLTVDQYRRQLGGLQGSLARAAEALCQQGTDLDALRHALLQLVRVDAEGRFVRRPRAWHEMPAAAQPVLERFVQARLLVARTDDAGERVVEVAHEALLRSWDRMATWLAADRDFLLWQERVRAAAADWQRNGRSASLLLRGPVLDEARRWFDERHDELDPDARAFVGTSLEAHDAEQQARERRRRRTTAALVGAVALFGGLAAAAGWQWRQATEQRLLAQARQINTLADAVAPSRADLRLLLSAQSMKTAWTADGHAALIERLDGMARPQPTRWKPHPGAIRALALSTDGRSLASAGPQHLQVQSAAGEVHDLGSRNGHQYLHALAFSPAGDKLAAACEERVVCVWETTNWSVALRLPAGDGAVSAVAFSADGKWLASGHRGAGTVRLNTLPGGEVSSALATESKGIHDLAFSADGALLAISTLESVELWNFAKRSRVAQIPRSGQASIAFSPDGSRLAIGDTTLLRLLTLDDTDAAELKLDDEYPPAQPMSLSTFPRVAFSRDGQFVARSDDSAGLWIRSVANQASQTLAPGEAGALAFQPDGRLLSGGLDGRITEWDPRDRPQRRIGHAAAVHAVALSADGRWLASASAGDRLRIVETASGRDLRTLSLACDPGGLAFSADGRWLAALQDRSLRLLDTADGRVVGPFEHEDRITRLQFEDGGRRIATATRWDTEGGGRYAIKRPTRFRVWDVAAGTELGWRFEMELDAANAKTIAAKESLARVTVTEGGDAALARRADGWPLAYITDNVNHLPWPEYLRPEAMAARTAAGKELAGVALARTWRDDPSAEASFSFSADARYLAAAAGSEAQLWPLKAADLLAEACFRLPRNLSCSEWRRALGDLPYQKTCTQRPDPPDPDFCPRAR